MKTNAINKWLHLLMLKLPASEKPIFERKFFLLIYLQFPSYLFYTRVTSSINGKAWHAPTPYSFGGKNLRKVFAGGLTNFYFGGGITLLWGGGGGGNFVGGVI